ncbi:efflux RND transporter periplasmic adaptor subunit [Paenibacillus alginolyticus]|uniref:Efflux RND transporter periplasmic adaptor subunit n=1 Tax=Paenibacillus alginolyticus TaxID=59839 RepID=A0ABT4GEV8_9BACL|nr:efflux RND transporter periplasmic adaptor subunit [Paenibacillus alginolyticus]MCY9664168.1 efflux RND transporter periplasmic adaptor subunit [Paenibacillus alginolyticus]MCY9694725.1 efflux RND transporter periplasmic adaptor subunit [Paenibacillus alginolyticus]MEC0147104.1 efflux RND transporter periplasmic adaptor subunit [Paenibacillus alginolyticus]
MINDSSRKRKFKSRSMGVIVLLTAAAVLASACSAPGAKGAATVQLAPKAIKTDVIKKQKISNPIEQVADVAAGTTLDVVSKANGEVTEVLKKRGEYVEKGEVLFVIDNKDALSSKRKSELSVRSAQESLQQAKDNKVNNRKDLADNVTRSQTALKNAEQEYNKVRNEYDAGIAVQHQVDQSKQALDSAKMNLDAAQSKLSAFDNSDSISTIQTQAESASLALEDANRSLENYQVKAPGNGILTDFNVVVGQTVAAAAGKVGQVQQIDPIKIKTELTETNFLLVKGKQELIYYNPDSPDKKGTAKISYLAPIMSAATKTYTLELEVPNSDHQLQPGSRFMVQLTTETEEQVVAVPSLSVIREESDTFVFVQQGDQYQKRKVKLGRINGEYQEVIDGVKDGEKLVTAGQNTLKDGQKVDTASASVQPQATTTPAAK